MTFAYRIKGGNGKYWDRYAWTKLGQLFLQRSRAFGELKTIRGYHQFEKPTHNIREARVVKCQIKDV